MRVWIKTYKTSKNLTRRNRKLISYKITKLQVNTILDSLKQNEQLTMNKLLANMKNKYPKLDIISQYLRQIIEHAYNLKE